MGDNFSRLEITSLVFELLYFREGGGGGGVGEWGCGESYT